MNIHRADETFSAAPGSAAIQHMALMMAYGNEMLTVKKCPEDRY